MSVRACLPAITFFPRSKEVLGAKKRLKDLGVMVDFFLGFDGCLTLDSGLDPVIESGGDEAGGEQGSILD